MRFLIVRTNALSWRTRDLSLREVSSAQKVFSDLTFSGLSEEDYDKFSGWLDNSEVGEYEVFDTSDREVLVIRIK